MTLAYLGLGANLGQAQQTLQQALAMLAHQPTLSVKKTSSLYRTQPIAADGPDYYNCVAAIDTALAPHALLALCQMIEAAFGRERLYRNAPRTLDLDILLYGNTVMHETDLIIPHPRLTQRAFVLVPLLELDANIDIPLCGHASAFLAAVAEQRIEKICSS